MLPGQNLVVSAQNSGAGFTPSELCLLKAPLLAWFHHCLRFKKPLLGTDVSKRDRNPRALPCLLLLRSGAGRGSGRCWGAQTGAQPGPSTLGTDGAGTGTWDLSRANGSHGAL